MTIEPTIPWNPSGHRIAVIGLAATGLATARILADLGAVVTVYDGKPEEKLDAARVAEARSLAGVTLALGVGEPDWEQTDLVVPSPGVPQHAAPIAGALARSIPVWSEIEVAYLLAKAPILAITGTNGKTTTTALVGAICREAGLKTWVAGNIAEDEGKRTPLIQAAVEAPADGVIVAEISSFQLEWVHRFRPKVAAWLNLSIDHMDRYAGMHEYAEAKARIFAAQTEDDFAVVNADDSAVYANSRGIGHGVRRLFSTYNENGFTDGKGAWIVSGEIWRGVDAAGNICGGVRRFIYLDGEELMSTALMPLPGDHNIQNVMAAALIADAIGIDLPTIAAAVATFRGVAHRMEFVAEIDGVRYINNSMCTNPAAVSASVSAIDGPLVAISGGIHKGGDLTPMYRALARHARQVVLIGAAKTEIADGLRAAGMDIGAIKFADTLPAAVEKAKAIAACSDTVMLVPGCASFDMFSGFEERGQVFREAVRGLSASQIAPTHAPQETGE